MAAILMSNPWRLEQRIYGAVGPAQVAFSFALIAAYKGCGKRMEAEPASMMVFCEEREMF